MPSPARSAAKITIPPIAGAIKVGRLIEGVKWLYDSSSGEKVLALNPVVLGWTNGKIFIPLSFRFWKRPLSAVASAFADAGFGIDRIAEPRPSPEALERYPAELADIADIPNFIVYRLTLVG